MNLGPLKDKETKKDLLIILVCATIMIAGGLAARALNPETSGSSEEKLAEVKTTPIGDHEAIKAEVIDDDPSHYMIDVEQLANLGVDDEADTFAVYVTGDEPETCGDFTDLELSYEKPEEHKRLFDLSDHPEILNAIDHYGCIAMKNIPPSKASS